MTHKVVEVREGSAYAGTKVPFSTSASQIKKMLEKYGCTTIGEMQKAGEKYPLHTLVFEHHGINYIIEFPVTFYVSQGGRVKKLNMNISGRIIHDRMKALLIAVDIDYMSFRQAMMECLAVAGPSGRPVSLAQQVEECGEQLQQGFNILQCLPGGDR